MTGIETQPKPLFKTILSISKGEILQAQLANTRIYCNCSVARGGVCNEISPEPEGCPDSLMIFYCIPRLSWQYSHSQLEPREEAQYFIIYFLLSGTISSSAWVSVETGAPALVVLIRQLVSKFIYFVQQYLVCGWDSIKTHHCSGTIIGNTLSL